MGWRHKAFASAINIITSSKCKVHEHSERSLTAATKVNAFSKGFLGVQAMLTAREYELISFWCFTSLQNELIIGFYTQFCHAWC